MNKDGEVPVGQKKSCLQVQIRFPFYGEKCSARKQIYMGQCKRETNILKLKEQKQRLGIKRGESEAHCGRSAGTVDLVVLVIPIDKAAPRDASFCLSSRTIRDILDARMQCRL